MRRARLMATFIVLATAVALIACSGGGASPTPTVMPQLASLPIDFGTKLDTPAPGFSLIDQFGRPVSLSQFRGKVVVLAFIDSVCTTICPLTTSSMVNAVRLLPPAEAANVQLLGVNVNLEHAAVSDVKAYSVAHGVENSWAFGTGTPAQLRAVWKAYHVEVQVVQGQVAHTPALYVIDQRGRERRLFLTSTQFSVVDPQSYVLATAVASLLPGHPHVTEPGDVAHLPSQDTTQTALHLPNVNAAASAKTVTLGAGAPRLTLFFASWLPGAASALADLGAYGSGANAAGLPPLVAIDVGTTEPAPTTLAAFLAGVPDAITVPVAVDVRGTIADAYDVQDLPWFTLTSSTGKVLWTHDGFMSARALRTAVRAALAGATATPTTTPTQAAGQMG